MNPLQTVVCRAAPTLTRRTQMNLSSLSDGSLSGLCQEVLQEIAEHREERRVLYPHSVFVYVNLCDVGGVPTDDKYV